MTPQPNEPTADAISKAAILIIRAELRNEGEGTHEEMQEAYDENEWYLNESKRVESIIESMVAAPLREQVTGLQGLDRQNEAIIATLRAENERLKQQVDIMRFNHPAGNPACPVCRGEIGVHYIHITELTQLRASLSTAVDALERFVGDMTEEMCKDHEAYPPYEFSDSDLAFAYRTLAKLRPLLAGKPPISDDGNGVVRKPPLTSQDYSKKASTNSGAMEPDAANVANSQCDPAAHCITRPSSDYSAQTPAAEGGAKWRCERCGKQFEVDSPLCYCRACEIAVRASAQAGKGNT